MDLEKYTNNPKTSFFAESYAKLLREEEETTKMLEKDASLKELVGEDLKRINEKKERAFIVFIIPNNLKSFDEDSSIC